MKRTFASIVLTAFMVVTLALTSLTMAVARGKTHIAGEVVICTGYGVTTISVDAEGNPVGPVQLCPDMVLAMLSALEAPPPTVSRPEGLAHTLEPVTTALTSGLSTPIPRARAPPVSG